jgi:hypothetical protein
MSTVLLAICDPILRLACGEELHVSGHTALTIDRPLAALSLAQIIAWDVLVVDSSPLGRETMLTAGRPSVRVIGVGFDCEGLDQALDLPLTSEALLQSVSVEHPRDAIGSLTLDSGRRLVSADGREVTLTRIEFRLLRTLFAQRPLDVPLDRLLDDVWGTTEGMGTAELVRTHVRNLRQKLAHIGLPDAIRTHRGQGYALEA